MVLVGAARHPRRADPVLEDLAEPREGAGEAGARAAIIDVLIGDEAAARRASHRRQALSHVRPTHSSGWPSRIGSAAPPKSGSAKAVHEPALTADIGPCPAARLCSGCVLLRASDAICNNTPLSSGETRYFSNNQFDGVDEEKIKAMTYG